MVLEEERSCRYSVCCVHAVTGSSIYQGGALLQDDALRNFSLQVPLLGRHHAIDDATICDHLDLRSKENRSSSAAGPSKARSSAG